MTDDEISDGIRRPGRFDAVAGSEGDAERLVRTALPHAVELPPAEAGVPYPPPPPGTRAWYQRHPAEPDVGNELPHFKYADWTGGKKGRGRELGAHFLPTHTAGGGLTMSVMFEVYYRAPADEGREADLTRAVESLGGRLDVREDTEQPGGPIILTYEFDDSGRAEAAARALRARGEHVEGPQDYGA